MRVQRWTLIQAEPPVREMKWRSIVIFMLLGLIVAGYFGPWVAHKDAGLILSADDLAEFVKFMPVVRSGELGLVRELFFAPIWIAAMGVALCGGRTRIFAVRSVCLLLSWLLVFTPLPPFTFLVDAYRSPEFGLTFWVTVAAAVISLAFAIFGSHFSDRVTGSLWVLFGLGTAAIAPLNFIKVQPEIAKLYPFSLGWGWVVTVIGGVGLIVIGLVEIIQRDQKHSSSA